jgi:hypothetical protein
MEMIEKRISDGSVLQLIRKWIQVGVIDEGRLLVSETGTGQGQTISPLLANIYLHYVLDKWFEQEVKPRLKGTAYEIRFADDAVLCFQYREDAEKGDGGLTETICKIRSDASPGEDPAGGVWAIRGGTREAAGEETSHVRFPRIHPHLRTQPKRENHSESADDEEASPPGPDGNRRLVPGEPPRSCGGTAANP